MSMRTRTRHECLGLQTCTTQLMQRTTCDTPIKIDSKAPHKSGAANSPCCISHDAKEDLRTPTPEGDHEGLPVMYKTNGIERALVLLVDPLVCHPAVVALSVETPGLYIPTKTEEHARQEATAPHGLDAANELLPSAFSCTGS